MLEGEEVDHGGEEEEEALFVKLTRSVVKYFYEAKDLILVDVIIKEKCVTEKRLEEVLKYDLKLLRATLLTLKKERILSMKTEKEVNSDGKSVKVNYYFIKFGELVNVFKYKLENVRNRLETLERELSLANTFTCQFCSKKWTDMEAGELFNQKYMKFFCRFCGKPVQEDTTAIPADTRQLVMKFNEQLGPLYDMMREIELHFQNK